MNFVVLHTSWIWQVCQLEKLATLTAGIKVIKADGKDISL